MLIITIIEPINHFMAIIGLIIIKKKGINRKCLEKHIIMVTVTTSIMVAMVTMSILYILGGISKGTIALIIFLGVSCCACLIFIIYRNGLHRFSIKDSECE